MTKKFKISETGKIVRDYDAEQLRELAKRAVKNRDEVVDIEEWARRLADDIKNADD